ncbi:hypothetical protein T11_4298 [Trichinella zimbabwensis]|uniref:Uncharacterized protein n=1 Tax=Trichinella zimbabwensis TaxID=268475 RepID=A0A0V1GYU8_9BILA|nr:hypothetical protein T11_4298 [Trichinella zimbabwensis]
MFLNGNIGHFRRFLIDKEASLVHYPATLIALVSAFFPAYCTSPPTARLQAMPPRTARLRWQMAPRTGPRYSSRLYTQQMHGVVSSET